MIIKKYPNTSIGSKNISHLYFGGTDYLSLQNNEAFISIVTKNIKKWGVSFGSSRNANIKLSIYNDFEKYFADFLGFESVTSISSCTLASLIIKDTVDFNTTKAFYINDSHPSIVFENSESIFIDDVLNPHLLSSEIEDILIATDAVLTSQTAPINFDFINKINKNKSITLLIDESHSLGVLGGNGEGIYSNINIPNIKRKIMIASFSKAMGVSGAVIAGDQSFIERIKKNKLYIGASGVNPAFLQSLIDSRKLQENQLAKLRINIQYFYRNLNNSTIRFSKDYPVGYYPKEFQNIFEKNNVITTNFIYGKVAVNRFVIKAAHTLDDLDILLSILNP